MHTIFGAEVPSGDFEITMGELRVVARYVAETAEHLLPAFEEATLSDPRPRTAIVAAWQFIDGAARSKVQRLSSLDAHRAAKEAPTETARLAAQAAGDAASAAYLHPIARAHQVGHILRAAANAVRIAEISTCPDSAAVRLAIGQAEDRASPELVDVLCRYPAAPRGTSRISQLMSTLDVRLRALRWDEPTA